MKWFQTDSDAPNDPKLKAIMRRGVDPNPGQAAAGVTFLLWCYVANHGGGEPGLGVKADGHALPLEEMASECLFDDAAGMVQFLDGAAGVRLIHRDVWQQKQIVFLPAMWDRTAQYYRKQNRPISAFTSAQQVADTLLTGGQLPVTEHDPIPAKVRQGVYDRDQRRCRYCAADLDAAPQKRCLDRVLPFVLDGQPDNLVTSCKRCSAKKAGRTVEQAGMVLLPPPPAVTPLTGGRRSTTTGHQQKQDITAPDQSDGPGPDLLAQAGTTAVDAVVKLWNTERVPGPKVLQVTPDRRDKLARLLTRHPNLDDWRKVIHYVNRQAWCNAPGTGDHPGWRLDLDYLLRPGKFVASLERLATDRATISPDGTVGRDARRGTTGTQPGKFKRALDGEGGDA